MVNRLLPLFFFVPMVGAYQKIEPKGPRELRPVDVSAEAITCTYRLTFRLDTVAKYPQTEYFRLITAGTKSVFQSRKQLLIDSVYASYDNLPFSQATVGHMGEAIKSTPKAVFSYAIYKDMTIPKITFVDRIEPLSKYGYEEPANLFTWHITSKTSIVNGYTCQQATTVFRGREFIAWFTKQIPVSDGPYEFSGLPGLIVKIGDSKNAYSFELCNLAKSPVSVANMSLPKGVIPTTREKFRKGVADYNASIIDRASQFGVSFSNLESVKQNWKEKLSRRNNPLELQ